MPCQPHTHRIVNMIRRLISTATVALALPALILAGGAQAKTIPKKEKPAAAGKIPDKGKPGDKNKPDLVATTGDWSVYVSKGEKAKTCYALAQPKDRLPASLKRDPAYIFISTRPAENLKNEVSVIMGFGVKDGSVTPAEIGDESFDMLGKGSNAWVKNPAEEPKFVAALRKGSKLVLKMPSAKGNVTTDHYSLSGLGQALDRVAKECQ